MLEEMPPFPERESSILAKLKRKKGPGAASGLDDGRRDASSNDINGGVEPTASTLVSPGALHLGRMRSYSCLRSHPGPISCSLPPRPLPTSWGCGQPLPQRRPQLPPAQATSWWMSSRTARLHSPAWGPPRRKPSLGTALQPGPCPTSSSSRS